MKIPLYILAALILITALAACGRGSTGSSLELQDPWIRAIGARQMSAGETKMDSGTMTANTDGEASSMIGSTGAAYLTIKNNSQEADKLVAVGSDVAEAVEIHLNEMKDDVMTMRQVNGVDVPAGGEATLQPGGYHIMLIGLKRELVVGENVGLTLTFEKAGQITIEAEVRAP